MPGKRRRGRPVRRWMDNITRGYERICVEGKGHWGQGEVERKKRLYRPYMSRKSRKKKKEGRKKMFNISTGVEHGATVSSGKYASMFYIFVIYI